MENFGFGEGGKWVKGSLMVLCPESEAIWQYIQVGAASAQVPVSPSFLPNQKL